MSSKNNVNPDHYKVAGRDRPNEVVPPELERLDVETTNARGRGRKRNRIPGAPPVGESRKQDNGDEPR
jgi:hypothetical protein